MRDGLDRDLDAALAAGNAARIAKVYARAAEMLETEREIDGACFMLTQAWIFALEAGDPLAQELRARLVAHGRESER